MPDSKVLEKLDKIDTRLGAIDVHLATYNAQLEYHIQRTDALEVLVVETQTALKPVEAHVQRVNGIGVLIKYAGIVATIVAAVVAAVEWFSHV